MGSIGRSIAGGYDGLLFLGFIDELQALGFWKKSTG
jgi:hypothetical protein